MPKLLPILVPLLLLGVIAIAAQDLPQGANELERSAGELLQKEMKERFISGASVAVSRRGRVVFTKGFGWANIESSIAAGVDTRYQIGSTTKPFTAVAILMLVEDRRVGLDDPVSKYLPNLPTVYGGITIRQLLTHTSGINRDLRTGNTDDFTIDDFWKRLATAPVSFEPGKRWEYSNTGYIVLGLVIEAVTKRSFGDFVTDRIFRPLRMKDTSYLEPFSKGRNRAVGYDWIENSFRPSPYFSGGYAAGGLVSTVADLAKWDAALNTEKLLKRGSLQQMWKPAKLADGKQVSFDFRGRPTSYGLGWFLTERGGRPVAFHGGTVSGFSSQITRFSDSQLTVIAITNTKSGPDRFGHAEILVERLGGIYSPGTGAKEQ
ncbi:MAG TPA: serine hydrolase domain-containing protein [Pyrinomonadaceae bacterium]|nr:serine hydrolase domain-containing protein [Pyrinomonadaceae bacterium]